MVSLGSIIAEYPDNLKSRKRDLVREYLQYKLLEVIYSDAYYARKFAFLGGTCLRIVHQNSRFSEDIDFDQFDLSVDDFEALTKKIHLYFEGHGYAVETRNVVKGSFRCYIKFSGLLHAYGISGYRNEKITIQFDSFPQNYPFAPQPHLLNKFDILTEIYVTPPNLLLAQKIATIFGRKRSKGRDYFDVAFLLKFARPDYNYLELKLGVSTPEQLKGAILEHCKTVDLKALANDVEPFLFTSDQKRYVELFDKIITQELSTGR